MSKHPKEMKSGQDDEALVESAADEALEYADSPPWNQSVKILVAVASLVLVVAVVGQFTDLILRIVAAGIIAYVLTPVINFVSERTPLSRGAAIGVTYVVLILLVIGFFVVLGVSTFQQVQNLIDIIPTLVDNVASRIADIQVIKLGPLELDVAKYWTGIDWTALENQIVTGIGPALNQGGRTVLAILTSTVDVITAVFFTAVISIYLAIEAGRLGSRVSDAIYEPSYRRDIERVIREFDHIWRAYLRGQIVLALVIFMAVWLSLAIMGVQNAFGLGVLSGLLEFLPVVGPVIGAVVAAMVAFLQPANYMGLNPWMYALAVILIMGLIQQIENNILVPRIVGRALDLHPLVIIIGVFMGASLLGLIGAILAAPILATIKLLGSYAWRKMFDLPPFPRPEQVYHEPGAGLILRPWNWVRGRIKANDDGSD